MADRCPACLDPSKGLRHTCAGSGTWKAAEAHAADAVDAIEAGWPRFSVSTTFKIRALDELLVRDKLTELVTSLLEDDQVEDAMFTITEEAHV